MLLLLRSLLHVYYVQPLGIWLRFSSLLHVFVAKWLAVPPFSQTAVGAGAEAASAPRGRNQATGDASRKEYVASCRWGCKLIWGGGMSLVSENVFFDVCGWEVEFDGCVIVYL